MLFETIELHFVSPWPSNCTAPECEMPFMRWLWFCKDLKISQGCGCQLVDVVNCVAVDRELLLDVKSIDCTA